MTTANVTDPIKPTTQTSSFRLLLAGGIAALLLPFVVPIACNLCVHYGAFLPEDAAQAKTFFWGTGSTIVALLAGGGTIGTIGGSLTSRIGKTIAQLAGGMITAATPNGEGVGAPHMLAPIGAAAASLEGFEPSSQSNEDEHTVPDDDGTPSE